MRPKLKICLIVFELGVESKKAQRPLVPILNKNVAYDPRSDFHLLHSAELLSATFPAQLLRLISA